MNSGGGSNGLAIPGLATSLVAASGSRVEEEPRALWGITDDAEDRRALERGLGESHDLTALLGAAWAAGQSGTDPCEVDLCRLQRAAHHARECLSKLDRLGSGRHQERLRLQE